MTSVGGSPDINFSVYYLSQPLVYSFTLGVCDNTLILYHVRKTFCQVVREFYNLYLNGVLSRYDKDPYVSSLYCCIHVCF